MSEDTTGGLFCEKCAMGYSCVRHDPRPEGLIEDQKLRTAIAQAVQRAGGNDWLAADYVLLGPVAALVAQAHAAGADEERERWKSDICSICKTPYCGGGCEQDEMRAAADPDPEP